MSRKYHVTGSVDLHIVVDCIVEADSIQEAEDHVGANIENGYLEEYDINIQSQDLSTNLYEHE